MSVDIKTTDGHLTTVRRKTRTGSEWTVTADNDGWLTATAGIHDDAYGPLQLKPEDIPVFLGDLRLVSGGK